MPCPYEVVCNILVHQLLSVFICGDFDFAFALAVATARARIASYLCKRRALGARYLAVL
jgi:hypothetical protein